MRNLEIGLLAALMVLAVCISCGHSKQVSTPEGSEVTLHASTDLDLPKWLVDALSELERLQCPGGADPVVFARLKAKLSLALQEKAYARGASQISSSDTRVRDLRWTQAGEDSDVFLKWGYAALGDYDQNGTVNIADITPIAQNFGKSWSGDPYDDDDEVGYYSLAAVVDGSQNSIVDDNDILEIAGNFNNRIAGYRILGSNATNPDNAVVVTTIAYGDHADIADEPYSMRLSYRVDVSDPEFDQYAYYWVQPYDNTVPLNYGAYSDSDDILDEFPRDDDPTDLQPAPPDVPQAVEGIVYGTCETELTLTYVPGEGKYPLPLTGQTWNFGGAAQGSQTSSAATPTITLASTADDYSATVKVTNAFGDSATTPFTIQTTTDDLPPVVSSVNQSSFTPGEPATFTVIMAQGPKRSCLWDFGGGAWDSGSPPSDTSTEISPTMTLSSTPGYYDAWVEVSNQNNESPDHFEFQVRVGYPPTGVHVIVPEPIAVGEEVVFEATWDEQVSSPPLEFSWDFGLAHPDELLGPLVNVTMVNGGSYTGYLTVTNPIGTVVVPFNFRVYWNELLLRILPQETPQGPKEDSLPGDDGYVTIVAEGHDLAYPLASLAKAYLEYKKSQLACPEYPKLVEIEDETYAYPDEWNAGAVGASVWQLDGWWAPYGALAHLPEPYGRAGFFYDVVHPPYTDPLISVFPERAETHNQISVSLGPTGNYASVPGDTGDFFSFRMYLAQGISQGDFPFNAFIYCYALQGHTPITAYCNELPQDLSDY